MYPLKPGEVWTEPCNKLGCPICNPPRDWPPRRFLLPPIRFADMQFQPESD